MKWILILFSTICLAQPRGGTTGQFLKKNSSSNYDYSWANISTFSDATIQGITTFSGNISAADWSSAGTANGIKIRYTPSRLTNTTSTGTAATLLGGIIGGDTLVATSVSTYTETAPIRIKQFISGTNVTQGTRLSLICDGGINITTGSITMAGNINFSGGTRNIGTSDANTFTIRTNGSSRISVLSSGLVGVGPTPPTPTAYLHLAAGSATASTAPVKYTSGTVNTTAEAGAFEYNGSFYQTKASGLRYGLGGVIFESFADAGNSTTVETDLQSYTTPASTLAANGGKIVSNYAGTFVGSATATRQIKVYFAGTSIFDTGAITISTTSSWDIKVNIIRVSATVIRYAVTLNTQGASLSAYTSVGELTGLTLSNTNILKITGTAAGAGAATNDIVLKLSAGEWKPAAAN